MLGDAGTEVMLEHSEVLDEGNFMMNILGRNKDQRLYVLGAGRGSI